jgi:hypothetical protein
LPVRRDQLLRRCEVVHARFRIDDVHRHRQIAADQEVAAAAADVRALNREALGQLAADDGVEHVVIRRREPIVDTLIDRDVADRRR